MIRQLNTRPGRGWHHRFAKLSDQQPEDPEDHREYFINNEDSYGVNPLNISGFKLELRY